MELDKVVIQFQSRRNQAKASHTLGLELLRNAPEGLAQLFSADPQMWTPILLCTAIDDVLERFSGRAGVEQLWEALADNPAPSSVQDLVSHAGEQELVLTPLAAHAIDVLLASEHAAITPRLLELLETPALDVLPFIERWSHHPDDTIADLAALLQAESENTITPRTLRGVNRLLKSSCNRAALRCELKLYGRIWSVQYTPRRTSVRGYGKEVLDRDAEYLLASKATDPIYARTLSGPINYVIHDDPEALAAWGQEVIARGLKAPCALMILSMAQAFTQDSLAAVMHLWQAPSMPLRSALFSSVCRLAVIRKDSRFEEWGSFYHMLCDLNADEPGEIRILPQPEHAVVQVIKQVAAENPENALLCWRADELLRERGLSLPQMIDRSNAQVTLRNFRLVGDSLFTLLDGSDAEAEAAGAFMATLPPSHFSMFLTWLVGTLREKLTDDNELFLQRHALLTVTAAAALRMPSTFANLADPNIMEPLLVDAACLHNSPYGRRAALILLSLLRRVTKQVARAMRYGLRGEFESQAVLQSVERFRVFDADLIPELIKGLDDDSAIVVYMTVRLLSVIGRSERLKPEQRRLILEKLAEALRRPNIQRYAYEIRGGTGDDNPATIVPIIRLDRALYKAILEITNW